MANLIGCSCATGNGNTGLLECNEKLGITIGFGIQNMIAKDGVANTYDISAALGTQFVDSLKLDDKSKRMFPITNIRNIAYPKEDTQYLTDTSGQKEELREGIQSVTAEKWNPPAAFDLKLKQMKCNRNGAWEFTRAGVVGIVKGTIWQPIEMNSFAPSYKRQSPEAPAMEMLPFDWAATVEAGELWLLTWADLGTTYEAMLGLLDANLTEQTAPSAAASVTTIEVRITTDYGQGLIDNQTVDGLITASFLVTDVTTGLPAAALAAVEVVDDKYTLTYTQETPGDVMQLSMVLSTGFEGVYDYVEPV